MITDGDREGVWQGRGGFSLRVPRPLTLSLQVSEASAGPRRLHSLSTSSDTTADSFSSLNPEEVGARVGSGDHFLLSLLSWPERRHGWSPDPRRPRNPSPHFFHVTSAAATLLHSIQKAFIEFRGLRGSGACPQVHR